MRTLDALLAAIVAQPDEDTPRLAYADLLEEEGGESNAARAAFIRLQIERARLPRTDPRRAELQARETELADVWAWEWAAPLSNHVSEWVFRRGFIEKVEANLERPAEEIHTLLTLAPVRHIRDTGQFCDLGGVIEALPALAGLHGLEFWGLYAFEDPLVRQMLTSPHLANLRTLILCHDRNGNMVDDDVIIEGLKSPYRANLRTLGVNFDDMWRGPSEAVIRAMTELPHLAKVRKLFLSDTTLTTDLLAGLFRAMPRLERIDLHDASAPAAAWDLILKRARRGGLRWLRLSDAAVRDETGDGRADLYEDRAFRRALKRTDVRVDWYSEFVDPWNGGCWHGYEWGTLRNRQMEAFGPRVRAREYDQLERDFRALCRKFVSDAVTADIDAMAFGAYSEAIEEGLRAARAQAANNPEVKSFNVRVYGYSGGVDNIELGPDDWTDQFDARSSNIGFHALGETPGAPYPTVPESIKGAQGGPLDPGAVHLFQLARLVGALGRAAQRLELPLPFVLYWSGWYVRVW